MIAFVAGATGYTGREVVRVLLERGIETHAHVRPDSGALSSWKSRFADLGASIDTTAWRSEDLRASMSSIHPHLVFSLLGTTRARAARSRRGEGSAVEDSYEAVDFGLSKMLLDAAAGVEPAPRFVYLSAMGVGEDPGNPYYRARWKMEQALMRSPLPWIIARPAFISGPDREERRPAERVASTLTDAALGALATVGIAGPRRRYGSLTGRQLAGALVRLALDPEASNRVLEARDLRSETRP